MFTDFSAGSRNGKPLPEPPMRPIGQDGGVVRLATWNVHGSANPDLNRLASLLRESEADVVALQETKRHQADKIAVLLGWPKPFWSFKHWPLVGAPEGLALLSHLPMLRSHRIRVSSPLSLPISYTRRIAQQATFLADTGPLTVANIHLASGNSPQRPRQLQRLGAWQTAHQSHAHLLTGDFNDHPESDLLTSLITLGWHRLETGATNWHRSDLPHSPSNVIDHILAKGFNALDRVDIADFGALEALYELSDHLPVLADLDHSLING